MTVAEDKTYENINPLFHNAVNEFSKEEIEQANKFADNLYYRVGVNTIPCHVKSKNDKYISILNSWKQYQNNEIPKETFESWKEAGLFAYGIGVITGTIYRTENKGKFLTIIDIDRLEAVERFAECSGKDIKDIAKWTRVEWHENINSYHIFLITQKQFKNIGAGHGLEVHANNNLIFTSNSIHPDGKRWKAIDNELITVLTNVIELSVLQIAIDRYLRESTTDKMGYDSDDNEEALKEFMAYINNPNVKLTKGQRNPALYAQAKSYFFKYTGEFENLSDDAKLEKLKEWLDKQCEVPLTQEPGRRNEVEEVWNKVKRYFTGKREEERNQREDQLRQAKEEAKKNAPSMCEKKQLIAASLKYSVRNSLIENIWTRVSENPERFIVARRKEGDICKAVVSKRDQYNINDDNVDTTTKIYNLNYTTCMFRVFPIQITLHESPLKFLESPITYSIVFEDQNNKRFTTTGLIDQIIKELKGRPGCVVNAYQVSEVLAAIIGAFQDDGNLIMDKSVGFEGYYYSDEDKDIHISKIDFDKKHPFRTTEERLQCIEYLEKRIKFQTWQYQNRTTIDRRDVFASALRWTVSAPWNFVIKQMSPPTVRRYHKAFVHTGELDGGKTGLSQEMLSMHGNGSGQKEGSSIYSVPAGSANTEAKLGKIWSKTTYPVEISEIGNIESYGRNEDLVTIFKNGIETVKSRDGRKDDRYDAPFPACSALILNGNPDTTKKSELVKRMHVVRYSKEDRHDRNPDTPFNQLQAKEGHLIKVLGDWTMRWIWEHKEEMLLSGKYDGYQIADYAIHKFYESVGKQVPDWLTLWITDTALEELDIDEESLIRSMLNDHVNKTLTGKGAMTEETDTLEGRINTILDREYWGWIKEGKRVLTDGKDENGKPKFKVEITGNLDIDTSVLEIFRTRLPDLTFKKLGEIMGIKHRQNSKGRSVLSCSRKEFVGFIKGEEQVEGNTIESYSNNNI